MSSAAPNVLAAPRILVQDTVCVLPDSKEAESARARSGTPGPTARFCAPLPTAWSAALLVPRATPRGSACVPRIAHGMTPTVHSMGARAPRAHAATTASSVCRVRTAREEHAATASPERVCANVRATSGARSATNSAPRSTTLRAVATGTATQQTARVLASRMPLVVIGLVRVANSVFRPTFPLDAAPLVLCRALALCATAVARAVTGGAVVALR